MFSLLVWFSAASSHVVLFSSCRYSVCFRVLRLSCNHLGRLPILLSVCCSSLGFHRCDQSQIPLGSSSCASFFVMCSNSYGLTPFHFSFCFDQDRAIKYLHHLSGFSGAPLENSIQTFFFVFFLARFAFCVALAWQP